MKSKVYYMLYVFPDAHCWGLDLKHHYKRFGNAHKKFNRLIASGKYETVILRIEEEWENGSSVSKPIAIYTGVRKWTKKN
jgi:hypothetical protein